MPKPKKDPIKALEKAIYSVDTCGDITGYKCNWVITGHKEFEAHLRVEHPKGEHR